VSVWVRSRWSQAICARRLLRIDGDAVHRRFFSAVSMPASWRRRVARAARACVWASGRGRDLGKLGEDLRIKDIGFGQLARGPHRAHTVSSPGGYADALGGMGCRMTPRSRLSGH
jgi:hypothetical protein